MADVQLIPLVDLGLLGQGDVLSEPREIVDELSKQICEAFSTAGFLYIKNHGIEEKKISNLFQVADAFFQQPVEVKSLSARAKQGSNQGWVGCGVESLNPARPGDFKEAFNVDEPCNDSLRWPTSTVCPMFRENVQDFFSKCEALTHRILDLLAIGLGLEDKELFRKTHQNLSLDKNSTALRILCYPGITEPLKERQLRCGEHSDYGSITLLFQDDVGGLEVCKGNGEYVPARPIQGTVIVNIGDLMQRWTNDKLKSTRHRVVVPVEEELRCKARHSVAFFAHPSDDAVIECLDGSGHYPPITSRGYLEERFAATYL